MLRIGNIVNKFSDTTIITKTQVAGIIKIGDISYQKDQLFVLLPDEKDISLTVREAEVLDHLSANINQVVKKKDLLLALWGNDDYFNGKSLEVFISRLRRLFKASDKVSIKTFMGSVIS